MLKLLKTVQGIIPITNYDITQETSFMLKQGLYEQVVNTEIKDELRQLPEDSKHVKKIDSAESSSVLTQYLSEVVHKRS